MMNPVTIIGMGLSPRDLTEQHRSIIQKADILIGGKRHLAYFEHLTCLKKKISGDLTQLLKYIGERMNDRQIVVLASGDPLFYGIGTTISRELGGDNVRILPNISSVAAAFARIKVPWHDAATVSLHGRKPIRQLLETLAKSEKVAVLTDPQYHPAWLAGFCLEKGFQDFRMCVFEQMGEATERIRWLDLADAAGQNFAEPNLAILQRRVPGEPGDEPTLRLGLPASAYARQDELITKPEVRAVTISKLQLASGSVFWDLGAGSGSVAIEASLFITEGVIVAVEKNPERVEQIRRNRSRYRVTNLEVVQADLPEGLGGLPVPDRVFIGGGGRKIDLLIQEVHRRLQPGGIIVVNTVLLSSFQKALDALESLGFDLDIVQVQVNRSRTMPWDRRLEAENPVWIICGARRSE